ncbi:hypothetical protein, partial [Methylobacterium trifolii]|uniref:hypothetical protein n=1 Tax=Methylobacterium trifolii TaxID=1003092 RepID=UPI001EDFAD30
TFNGVVEDDDAVEGVEVIALHESIPCAVSRTHRLPCARDRVFDLLRVATEPADYFGVEKFTYKLNSSF